MRRACAIAAAYLAACLPAASDPAGALRPDAESADAGISVATIDSGPEDIAPDASSVAPPDSSPTDRGADAGFTDAGVEDTGVEDAGFEDAAEPLDSGPPPPELPLYRIALRVHTGESQLAEAELRTIFAEVSRIWWHGGVCFEIEVVRHDQAQSGGFDLWFAPSVPGEGGINGIYYGDHRIWSRDRPSLRRVPGGTEILAARTAAHELGHGLRLQHRQDDTNLMASGTTGWTLNAREIGIARGRAAEKALEGGQTSCGAPVFAP